MCIRDSYFGGKERPFVKNVEITLEQFKEWFPVEFLQGLDDCFACGSLGDPVIVKDCLEIFKYIRSVNERCTLSIHTNGSLRKTSWWEELAKYNVTVIFGIDGFKGEHELYRIGTNWDKIIENAKAFINAGGAAKADTIVFAHNENRVNELKDYLLSIGFESVNIRITNRFYGNNKFPVQDLNGKHVYDLETPKHPEWQTVTFKPNVARLVQKEEFTKLLDNATINPICVNKQEVYISAQGNVYPCCFAANETEYDVEEVDPNLTILRDRLVESTKQFNADITIPNLHGTNIIDALGLAKWETKLDKHWTTDKCFMCVKNCASNIKGIAE